MNPKLQQRIDRLNSRSAYCKKRLDEGNLDTLSKIVYAAEIKENDRIVASLIERPELH
jgi:hypothetical protein